MRTHFFFAPLAAVVLYCSVAFASGTTGSVSADEALSLLLKGNQAFTSQDAAPLIEKAKEAVAPDGTRYTTGKYGQAPYAVVVTCSDSRLSPEILFEKGIGEIFVVRVAGNVVAPHELGSIEYAAEHLGSKLVVVLGHSKCGAVKAAYDYYSTPRKLRPELSRNLGSIVDDLEPAVEKALDKGGDNELAADINIDDVVNQIKKKSRVMSEMMETSGVKIIGAKYDVETGAVTLH